MRKIAIFGFMAVAATLLAVAPASAGGPFTTQVLGNGTLLVTGDNSDNSVAACQIDEDSWEVGTFVHGEANGVAAPQTLQPEDHVIDVQQYDGVTTDARFNMRGGDDIVVMDCDLFLGGGGFAAGALNGGPSVPRDVIVLGGSGSDYVNLYDLYIGDDLNVNLGSGDDELYVDYVHVFDDMLISGQGGHDLVDIYDTEVYDRTSVNTGSGESWVDVYNLVTGRFNYVGGSSDDNIQVLEGIGGHTDLGFKPQFRTLSGNDNIGVGYYIGNGDGVLGGDPIDVSDRVLVNTGGGDDYVGLDLVGEFFLNVNTAAGDDYINADFTLIEDDLINCGAGFDVLWFVDDEGATIRNCEDDLGDN